MKNDDRWQEADRWLERALAVPAAKRKALMEECPDPRLRAQVLRLIELAERPDGLLAPGALIGQRAEAEEHEALGRAPVFEVGHRLLGRYVLADKVGQGAMGAVFRARDIKLDRDVAVKIVTGFGVDPHACERLLREARAAAALNHPNVVAIHDVGEQEAQPFIVMELIEGATLETRPPKGLEQMVETVCEICAALEHAHSRGIVHRDLKPSNVLVVDTERGRTVKLVDLGLALARGRDRVTAEGHVMGTPSYMAPEQALGKDVDGRVDLYALGVMMYLWATGELPFAGDDALAVVAQHINATVVPPRTRVPEIPAELDAIITRLLAKDPAERFNTAGELDAVLRAMIQADDTVDTLQFPAARSPDGSELSQGINRRLTGASQLPSMYGREEILESVADAVRRLMEADAEDSGGSVLLIAGDPGAGKSRLVAEVAQVAGQAGALVLAGAATELSSRLPYAPFVEAWVEYVRSSNRPAAENPFASFEPTPDRMQENTLRLFQAVETAIYRSAGDRPVVVIVEDLHWADDSSLRLFHELHVRTATRPMLLVGTYREMDVAHQGTLQSMLSHLKRHRLVTRLRLEPLSADETLAQIEALSGRSDPGSGFAERVYALSGGNPLFTEEIVRDAIERGNPIASVTIPESLAGVVQERVDRLGEVAQKLLRTASVAGDSYRFEWIRDASELDQAEAVDALEASLRSGLLEEDGDRYRFRHALVRDAIYAGLSRERRKVLHGAIANAIRDSEPGDDTSGRDGRLAHHYQAAGRPLDAVPHLIAAGRFAMWRTGFEEARVAFETALEILDAHGETSGARRFRLTSGLGSMNLALAKLDTARDYFEAAAALPPSEDGWALTPEERARALRWAAVTRINSGDLKRANELLSDAMAGLPEGSPELPSVLYHVAQLQWSEGNHEDAYKTAERAVVEAERANNPEGVAKGYEMLALACHSMGEWREGVEFVEKRKKIVGDAVDVAEAFDAHL